MPRDLHEYLKQYRQQNRIVGNRPVYVKVYKSEKHPYKGNYLLTYTDEGLNFHELNFFLKSKGKNNFKINYEDLESFRLKYFKYNSRLMILNLKSGDEVQLSYLYDCPEAFDNEANINYICKLLKQKSISQLSNQKKGDSHEQRQISKYDQAFTQEIRASQSKRTKTNKRRLFKTNRP